MIRYRCGARIVFGVFLLLSSWYESAAQQKSLLWEITGNDLKHPSYLFGTIHLICPGEFTPGDSLMHALHNSKHLLLELDLTDPGLAAGLMNSMLMKENKKLTDLLPESQYQKVAGFFRDSIHFDLGMLAGFKPFLLSSLLYNYILQCPMESVEGRLAELAKSAGLSITGLETADEQAAVFDRIPYHTQAELELQPFNGGIY